MKEKLRDMYESQLIDTTGLLKAIERGWATISDIVEIVGEDNALSVIMTAKLSEISNACNTVIVSGVDITFGEESVHFNLSIEDQSNINNHTSLTVVYAEFIRLPKLYKFILPHRHLLHLKPPIITN